MRENRVKRKLAEGGVSLGTMVFEFDTPGMGRIAAGAGAEFICYDMEHTGWTTETIRRLIASTRAADIMPMVRVPATQYHFIAQTLDAGAMSIMVPMEETPDQARDIVRFAKYPPQGRRGTAFSIAHDDYQGGDVLTKMESANQETLLVAQIETARGVENVEAIAAVEGIDVLWIGHFDLSTSLGIPAQFDHPDFLAAVDRVVAACVAEGKAPGILAGDILSGQQWLAKGFRAIAYGGDLWLYAAALREGLDALRAQSPDA
jgi:2-keto-3-deoxy-L-rhamnonate aldolase RhmA